MKSMLRMTYKKGQFFDLTVTEISDLTMRYILILGWSAFLLYGLLEAMRMYQF